MGTKKAPVSAATLTRAGLHSVPGQESDFILAHNIWSSLIEIWGQERGLVLEVKRKGEEKQVV